ncbi:hypothetical protein GCM10007061_00260 [Kocuria marina]|nr:hypothetical protein GCM10007061_00260 [Kocuria marina]
MTTSSARPASLRRRQGLTEQAAQAAIDQACRRLRLPTIRAVVDDAVAAATKEQLTYQGFLAELLLAEVDDRDRRSTPRRIKSSGFPREKWLADFDFDVNPNINPATINELATGDWIRRGDPLCLIGDSGTDKSHLLIALGTAAAEQGYRVRYTLATRLHLHRPPLVRSDRRSPHLQRHHHRDRHPLLPPRAHPRPPNRCMTSIIRVLPKSDTPPPRSVGTEGFAGSLGVAGCVVGGRGDHGSR